MKCEMATYVTRLQIFFNRHDSTDYRLEFDTIPDLPSNKIDRDVEIDQAKLKRLFLQDITRIVDYHSGTVAFEE